MIVGVSEQRRSVVIGAGLLGLAAAWSLSRRGWRVTVVEAAPTAGHVRSGSKGSARIFRFGYPDPLYVDMAHSARRLWHDLERMSGRRLLTRTGQVTLGSATVLDAIASAMEGAGLAVQSLGADEAARRVPQVTARDPVLFEPESGVLQADACLDAFRATGDFELRTGLGLVSLDRGTDGVVVHCAETTLTAEVAVVCAGPRTLDLLGLRPRAAAPASFAQVAYFASKEGRALPPVFIEWDDDMTYGLPVPGGPASAPALCKVSRHTAGVARGGPGFAARHTRRRPPPSAWSRRRARPHRRCRGPTTPGRGRSAARSPRSPGTRRDTRPPARPRTRARTARGPAL